MNFCFHCLDFFTRGRHCVLQPPRAVVLPQMYSLLLNNVRLHIGMYRNMFYSAGACNRRSAMAIVTTSGSKDRGFESRFRLCIAKLLIDLMCTVWK
jgi:hypothetical protein